MDHSHSFPYSFFVTNRKRERTVPAKVRSFSHTQVLQSIEIKVHIWHRINFWIENNFRFDVSPLYHFMPSDRIFLWTE